MIFLNRLCHQQSGNTGKIILGLDKPLVLSILGKTDLDGQNTIELSSWSCRGSG